MYATRFDHPYEQEPIVPASKELFGALFLEKNFNFYDWYQDDIFPGQSKTVRWREFYLCTYDLSYFALITLGGIVGLISLRKFVCKKITQKPEIGYLGLWSLASTFFLVVFYLHTPAIASRYMPGGGNALGPRHLACIEPFLIIFAAFGLKRYPIVGSTLGGISILLTGTATLIDAMPTGGILNPLFNYYPALVLHGGGWILDG